MRITLIQPAMGHRYGEKYIRSWQMEPLAIANLAGLTPRSVTTVFYDDRLERIPFDEPTDVVVMPVETYTARRAYQIASLYRIRQIPVILGGFHPTLVPEEAQQHAESIVLGEAETVWHEVIDDLLHGTLKPRYLGSRGELTSLPVDRSIFKGKRYLPIGLVETGRGCLNTCDFCAVQRFFQQSYRYRPVAAVIREIQAMKQQKKKLFFFTDDNFAAEMSSGRDLLPNLKPLSVRWITQMSIHAAHDEDFVHQLFSSGCRGVLIGFESLDVTNLQLMNKPFNMMKTGYEGALSNLRKHGIGVYGTFVFGYDHDTLHSFQEAASFAIKHSFYLAAFNHLTPFPGTPLYQRLEQQKRLRFQPWWLDTRYRYNEVPFLPRSMPPEAITQGCLAARRCFYSSSSILNRCLKNRRDWFMFRNYFPINALHKREISLRNGYPLGDTTT